MSILSDKEGDFTDLVLNYLELSNDMKHSQLVCYDISVYYGSTTKNISVILVYY